MLHLGRKTSMMLSARNPLRAGKSYRIKEGVGYPAPWSPIRTRLVDVLEVINHSDLSAFYSVCYTEHWDNGRTRHNVHGTINQGIGESDSYRVVAFEELIPVTTIH